MDLNAQGLMFSIMIVNPEKKKKVVILFPQRRVFDFSLSQESITGKARKLFHCSFLQVGSLIKKTQTNKKKKNPTLFIIWKKKEIKREKINGFPYDC